MNCEVCSDMKEINSTKCNDILQEVIGQKYKADPVWISNAYAHTIWKLAAYGLEIKSDEEAFLTAKNVMYHLLALYKDEFNGSRRSFFQKVLEKDDVAGRHFVGIVAAIRKVNKSETLLLISDGRFCLQSSVNQGLGIGNLDTSDGKIASLIELGKL